MVAKKEKNMITEINGVVYDTKQASIDKQFTFGKPGDPNGYEETLYITDKGDYFIYTNGGPQSKYTRENIIPISREQVKDWILSH